MTKVGLIKANYEVCRMFACEKSKRKDRVGVFFERVKESAEEAQAICYSS